MKYFLALIYIFFLISPVHAVNLKLNQTYSGTIKDNYGNVIVLPPGDFNVEEIRRDGVYYYQVDFYNNKDDIWVQISAPTQNQGLANSWKGGIPSACKDKDTLAKNIQRKGVTGMEEWCVYLRDGWIEFANIFVSKNKSTWAYYYFNPSSIDNRIKGQGDKIYSEYKKAVSKGDKLASLDFLISFYNHQSNPDTESDDTKSSIPKSSGPL